MNKIIMINEKSEKTTYVWADSEKKFYVLKTLDMGSAKKECGNKQIRLKTKNNFSNKEIEDYFKSDDSFVKYDSIRINKDIIMELRYKLSKLGSIINFGLTINILNRKQHINYLNIDSLSRNSKIKAFIHLIITINCNGNMLDIHRNKGFNISDANDLYEHINNIFNDIFHYYKPYIMRKMIDITTKDYDIVLPAGLGGIFIHEAIGHCLEADTYFEDNSVLNNRLGSRITNQEITIIDSCNPNDDIFYKRSCDGSFPKNVELIKDGYISGILSDYKTSQIFGITDTGNGRSSSYQHPSIPRMRNTYLKAGKESKNEIVKNIQKGVYVLEIGGGNVNTTTGDFLFEINHGLLIEHGEMTNLTNKIMFSGNVLMSLNNIKSIGNDLKMESAFCGKKGQLINVSFGSPTMCIVNE